MRSRRKDQVPTFDDASSVGRSHEPLPAALGRYRYMVAAAGVFAVFVALAWLDRQVAAELKADLQWTQHTLEVQSQLRSISALVAEMEAAERGYLLRGE